MQVLLDECLPCRLAARLLGHAVFTVAQRGWSGRRNGELLSLATAAGFQAFLTIDQNLVAQQRLQAPPMVIVVLRAGSNRLAHIEPLVPELLTELENPQPRVVVVALEPQ